MKYIKFTYADAKTGIPGSEKPMKNGPTFPKIENLQFKFALESEYPTKNPTFIGTTTGSTNIPGILAELTEEEYTQIKDSEILARYALINQQVVTQIRTKYSAEDEIKLLRLAPSDETTEWNKYVEECRDWGKEQKAAILAQFNEVK